MFGFRTVGWLKREISEEKITLLSNMMCGSLDMSRHDGNTLFRKPKTALA